MKRKNGRQRVEDSRKKLGLDIPAPDGLFGVFPEAFLETLAREVRYVVHVKQATPYYALTRERFWRWMHLSIFNPLPRYPKPPYPLPASLIMEWQTKQKPVRN